MTNREDLANSSMDSSNIRARLRISNAFESSSQRDASNESLERIHTFSLKTSFNNKSKDSSTVLGVGGADKIPSLPDNPDRSQSKHSIGSKNQDDSIGKETGAAGGKTYYVEESVKILEGIIMKADPILSELASKVK